jgi:hypothetical protein
MNNTSQIGSLVPPLALDNADVNAKTPRHHGKKKTPGKEHGSKNSFCPQIGEVIAGWIICGNLRHLRASIFSCFYLCSSVA